MSTAATMPMMGGSDGSGSSSDASELYKRLLAAGMGDMAADANSVQGPANTRTGVGNGPTPPMTAPVTPANLMPPASASAGPSGVPRPTGANAIPTPRLGTVSDINMGALPATPRLERQQSQFDQSAFLPQPTMKSALLHAGLEAAGAFAARRAGHGYNLATSAGYLPGVVEGQRYREAQNVAQQGVQTNQMNQQRELQEKQLEATMRERTIQAELESVNAYRSGMLGQRQYSTDTRAQTSVMQNRMKALGLGFDPNTDMPLPIDHLSLPQQQKVEYQQAAAEYAKARQDEIMNPSNPTFQQKAEALHLRVEQLQLALAGFGLRADANNMAHQSLEANLYGTNNGVALPGTYTTDQGTPIGKDFQVNARPTQQTRQAGAVIYGQKELTDFLQNPQVQQELGPVWGRIGHLRDLASVAPPLFAQVQTMAESWAALQPQLHGARGIRAIDAFENFIGGMPQTSEVLAAKIKGLGLAAEAIQQGGTPNLTGGRVLVGPVATPIVPPGGVGGGGAPNLQKKPIATPNNPNQPAAPGLRIRVKNLETGQTGTILKNDYNPRKYQQIGGQ